MKSMLAWVTCLVFWALASMLSGAKEPWDAASFWCCIYPAALALSAVLGALFQRANWAAGAMVMFAQLPVTLVSAEASPLLAAGGHLRRYPRHSGDDDLVVRRWNPAPMRRGVTSPQQG